MKQQHKQLMNYIIGILAIVGIAAGLVFFAGAENSEDSKSTDGAYSAGILTALEDDFNFGTIRMKDGDVSHKFLLKNNSDEVIRIESVSTSCMCTKAYLYGKAGIKKGPFGMPGHSGQASSANLELDAGETVELEAVFDPAAHGPQGVGKIKRVVYIETNSQTNPELQLKFEAEVIN